MTTEDLDTRLGEILDRLLPTPFPNHNMGLLPDEMDEDDERRTRSNLQYEQDKDEALAQLKILVDEARIEELETLHKNMQTLQGFYPVGIQHRISELQKRIEG